MSEQMSEQWPKERITKIREGVEESRRLGYTSTPFIDWNDLLSALSEIERLQEFSDKQHAAIDFACDKILALRGLVRELVKELGDWFFRADTMLMKADPVTHI